MLYFAMKIFLILLLQCILQAKSCGESQFEINQPPLMPQAKNLIENFDTLQCNTIHGPVVVRPIDERDAAPSPRRKRQAKKTKLSKQALNKIYFERRLKKFSVKSQIRKSLSRRGFFTAGTTRNVMRRYVRGKGRIVMSAKGKLAKKNLPRHFKKSQDVACDLGIFKKEGDEERFLKAKLNPRQPAGRKKEQYDENRPMNPAQQKRKEYDQYSAKNRQNNRGQDQRGGNERPKNPRKEKRKEYEQRSAANRQKDAKPQIRKPYDQPQGNRFERPYDKQGTTRKLFQATLDLDEEINRLVTAKRGGKREEKSGRKEFGFRKDDNKLRDRERTTWYLTKKRHGRFRTMANIPSDEDRSAMVKFIPSTRGPYTTGKKTYSFLQEVEGERENQEQREREYKWMMYEAHEATRFGFVTKRKKKTTPLPAPKKVHSDEYMYEYKDESGCVVENYKPKTSPKGVQQDTEKPTPLSIESGDHQEEKKNRKSDKDSTYDDVYSSDEGSQSSYNEFSYDHKKSVSHSSSEDNKYSYDESHSSGKSADDDEYSSYESYDKSGKKKTSRSSDDKKTTHHKSAKPSKTTGLNDESVSSDSLDSVDHEYSYKDFQSLLNESSISEDKRSTMTTLRYRDIEKLIHSDEEGDNNSDSNDNPISKIDANEQLNKRAKKSDKNDKTSGKKKSKKSDNDETYSSNDENSRTEDESVDQAGAYDSDSDGEYPVYETSEEERTKRTFSDVSSGSSIDESDRHENEPLSSSDFYESDEYYKSDDSKDDRLEYDNSLHESSYDFAETKEKKRSRKKTTAKDIDHLDHSLESEEELTTTRKKILTSHLPLTTRSLSSHKLSSHQSKISSLSSHIDESTLTPVTKKPRSSRRTISAGNSVYTMVSTNQSSVASKATREKPSTTQLSQNLNISPGAELTSDSLNITKKTRKPYTRKPKTTPISLQPQR